MFWKSLFKYVDPKKLEKVNEKAKKSSIKPREKWKATQLNRIFLIMIHQKPRPLVSPWAKRQKLKTSQIQIVILTFALKTLTFHLETSELCSIMKLKYWHFCIIILIKKKDHFCVVLILILLTVDDIAWLAETVSEKLLSSKWLARKYFLTKKNFTKTSLAYKLNRTKRGQLKIASHIRILHVEQEVHGDETLCVDSVLSCDLKRQSLLDKEKELNDKLHR